jgi:hypothetical protein
MREARYEHALEVGHDRLERLAVFGRIVWQSPGDVARFDSREHRVALNVVEVVSDPIDEPVTVTAEIFRVHHGA